MLLVKNQILCARLGETKYQKTKYRIIKFVFTKTKKRKHSTFRLPLRKFVFDSIGFTVLKRILAWKTWKAWSDCLSDENLTSLCTWLHSVGSTKVWHRCALPWQHLQSDRSSEVAISVILIHQICSIVNQTILSWSNSTEHYMGA
jgi:hypothetical protein